MTFLEVVYCIALLLCAGLIGFLGGYYEKLFRKTMEIVTSDVVAGTKWYVNGTKIEGMHERRMK